MAWGEARDTTFSEWERLMGALFSGEHDHLTVEEFRKKMSSFAGRGHHAPGLVVETGDPLCLTCNSPVLPGETHTAFQAVPGCCRITRTKEGQ